VRIGDRGPRHLNYPLLEVDFRQSTGVTVVPAVFGLGERGQARCRSIFFVFPAQRFGRPGRLGALPVRSSRYTVFLPFPFSDLDFSDLL
jgi:hypothetical protein